jgi:hypothetical protein
MEYGILVAIAPNIVNNGYHPSEYGPLNFATIHKKPNVRSQKNLQFPEYSAGPKNL